MTTVPSLTKVLFLPVKDNAAKLQKICGAVHTHYSKRERILVAVPSKEAASYIDQLLWKHPEESFLPHAISETPTKEPVAITTGNLNVNEASVLVNLAPGLPPDFEGIKKVYELYDMTSKEKEQQSLKKQAEYAALGCRPEILP